LGYLLTHGYLAFWLSAGLAKQPMVFFKALLHPLFCFLQNAKQMHLVRPLVLQLF
jgi:hypothetical protein